MYRILHISDLHRSPDDPVDNNALIAALDCDFESQQREDPRVDPIDAVIVSGDLIQGVSIGEADHQSKIRQQYEVAREFLDELSIRYLEGDRSKIVMVPGNHDVDWNTAKTAMSEVPADKQDPNLLKYLSQPHFRFCFRTRKLFLIDNFSHYEQRFDEYSRFVSEFYHDAKLTFPLVPRKYYNLFELDRGRIVVAAFNSCHHNDCYRYSGSIPDGIIGEAYLQIKDSRREYDMQLAVWHHGIYGPPGSTDYMDVELIREMTSRHFQLGLHGHQHRTEVHPEQIYLPSKEHMIVVSAGSLCVGAKELPPGEKRQYNIVEINNDYSSVRVHVREMVLERAFGPRKLHSFGGNSYIDLDVSSYRRKENRIRNIVLAAEESMSQNQYLKAVNTLTCDELPLPSHGRRLLLDACERGKLWSDLVEHFLPPDTISELMALIGAYETLEQISNAKQALNDYFASLHLPESQKKEIEDRLNLISRLKS